MSIRLFLIGLIVWIVQPSLGFAQAGNSEAKAAPSQAMYGLYGFGAAGGDFPGGLASTEKSTELYTEPGAIGLLGIGWDFGDGVRAELEGRYRSTSIHGIATLRDTGLLEPLSNPTGSLSSTAIMANGKYDLPVGGFGRGIRPYIGGGLGYASLRFNNAGGLGNTTFYLPLSNTYTSQDIVGFGSGHAFAYQALAGASVPLGFMPGLEATIEYAYFGTARADISVSRVATGDTLVNGVTPSNLTKNGFMIHDQSVTLGLRYYFGASAKAASR